MNYLLDTNILLIYLRDKEKRKLIEKLYNPLGKDSNPIISVVSVGEIRSIAKRNYWGEKRLKLLDEILNSLIVTDIHSEDVIEMYAEIDAYSQGKLKANPLPTTARNMGKNDLWIAATAKISNSTLLTTDKDFSHLEKSYLKLNLINL